MDTVYSAVGNILTASPAILIGLGGCLLAVFRWQRHPRASMLVLIAFPIYLFISILFPVLYAVLPAFLSERGWSATNYAILFRGFAFFHYLVEAVALALLLAAVYAGRGAQPNTSERNFA